MDLEDKLESISLKLNIAVGLAVFAFILNIIAFVINYQTRIVRDSQFDKVNSQLEEIMNYNKLHSAQGKHNKN